MPAQWTTCVAPLTTSARLSGSRTSPWTNRKFRCSARLVPPSVSRWRLSTATTSLSSTSRRASVVPMKPAPPVMTIRLPLRDTRRVYVRFRAAAARRRIRASRRRRRWREPGHPARPAAVPVERLEEGQRQRREPEGRESGARQGDRHHEQDEVVEPENRRQDETGCQDEREGPAITFAAVEIGRSPARQARTSNIAHAATTSTRAANSGMSRACNTANVE